MKLILNDLLRWLWLALKLLILGGLIVFAFYFKGHAQLLNGYGKPVRVGDRLPSSFWSYPHSFLQNDTITKTDLSEFRNKLLVLDFWASWCGSCIVKFPKADSLNRKYASHLKILLVNSTNTDDTLSKIRDVMTRKGNGMPSIVGDTLLSATFRHGLLPHHVWILDGFWMASTSSDFLTEANIDAMIRRLKLQEAARARKAVKK